MSTITVTQQNPTKPFKKDSARAKWWAVIKRHNGKDVEALKAAVAAKPPHTTKSGAVEPVTGWLGYFQREGLIEVK